MSAQGESADAGPVTATGTASRNIDGQAIAITTISSLRMFGALWLRLVFFYVTHFPKSSRNLGKLSFIHFARWTLITKLPGDEDELKHPHLFFESNFNGGWAEYIDAFSHILSGGMKTFWGTSYGFPGPLPTGPFKDYIKRNEIEASHFYSAYPEATTTIVLAALDIEEKLSAFRRQVHGASAEEFDAQWRVFLQGIEGEL